MINIYSVLGEPVEKCDNVDYVLTIFAHSMNSKMVELKSAERQKRIDKRRKVVKAEEFDRRVAEECEMKRMEEGTESLLLLKDSGKVHVQTQTDTPEQKAIGTQCSPSALCIRTPEARSPLIEGDDECTKFNIGLPSWAVFYHLATFLSSCCHNLSQSKLSPSNGLMLTLMRLRLNLLAEDLAYRFNIASSTASDIFNRYIDLMHVHLRFLIKWPTQETCRANMPCLFKDLYPRTRCIIDCSEIYIERPYTYKARAQTYSNYKKTLSSFLLESRRLVRYRICQSVGEVELLTSVLL